MAEPILPELYDALMTTRAMRHFTDEPVPDDVIESILAAAVQAPSGGNIQPYQFLVVTDPGKRAALGELYLRGWQRYAPAVAKLTPPPRTADDARVAERSWKASDDLAHNLAAVPALIIVLVPKISMDVADDEGTMDVGPVYASVYPAVQNVILAARAHGLGAVLTTIHRIHEADLRKVADVPDRYEIAAVLPVGHPTGRWGVARRRPAPTLTSWNTFGNRR